MKILSYDLQADADEGAWLALRDPRTDAPIYNDNGVQVRLKLLGHDSAKYQSEQRKMAKRLAGKKPQIEALESAGRELLASVVVGWEGILDDDGNDADCNFKNVIELFKQEPWAFSQADEFVMERANFIKTGEKD